MTLDEFLPYILPRAKGCPDMVANQATRLAIIELCRKAMIWREYQPAITTIALQTAYAYTPAADQQVITLLSVTLDDQDVPVVDPQQGKYYDQSGYVQNYAYGGFAGFEMRPAQEDGLSLVTYAVVAPALTAASVPDTMGQYVEAIANGALSRLLATEGKEYSKIGDAIHADTLWQKAINEAKSDARAGFARHAPRTASVRF